MSELTYREVGEAENGVHIIDAYDGKELVMTYRGYVSGRNPNVLILYPSMLGKYGAKVPGKHAVSIYKIQR